MNILEVFAYNRILVQRYTDALTVYALLVNLQPKKSKWKLAQALCLIHQNAHAQAASALSHLNPQDLNQDQSDMLSQVNQHIAYHPSTNQPTQEA